VFAKLKMEQWAVVHGYRAYKVSTHGNVMRVAGSRGCRADRLLKAAINSNGYHCVTLYDDAGQHKMLVHRLVALAFIANPDSLKCVDHVDGNPQNNHVSNLRFCTHQMNMFNIKSHVGSSSGFKGVSWHKPSKKWLAHISVDGKAKHIGIFDDEADAARAYDEVAREIHGDFMRPNFPM
jgi:hypothetical protein